MAKVSAPLFGFQARGSLAKSITFGNWRGIPYARQRVTPRNPKTSAQQSQRSAFSAASDAWKALPGDISAVWNDFASGQPFTGRNAFTSRNVAALRNQTGLGNLLLSPGTRSAPGMSSLSAVAGTDPGEIDVTFQAPTLPQGWTLGSVIVAAIVDAAPEDVTEWVWTVDEGPAAGGSFTLEGLTPATPYAVFAFIEVTRPDGVTAYTASRSAIATSA